MSKERLSLEQASEHRWSQQKTVTARLQVIRNYMVQLMYFDNLIERICSIWKENYYLLNDRYVHAVFEGPSDFL